MLRYLLACGLAAGMFGPARAAEPPWELRHNLTAAEYEKAAQDFTEKGYRPAQLSAAPVGKDREVRFLAVWEKTADAPAREARHDLAAERYEKTAAEMKEKSFRPVELCGYAVGDEPRFAAIWEKGPADAPAREAHHALTSDEYRALYPALSNKGYRPLRVTGYQVGKETRYATIWEKAPKDAPVWHSRRDLTAKQYQEVFSERAGVGDILVHVTGYTIDGEERFAGVWEKAVGNPGWQARHGLDAKQLEAAAAQLKGQELRALRVSSYAVDGQPRYAVVWVFAGKAFGPPGKPKKK